MREYLTIGSSPSDEPCAQIHEANYNKMMTLETKAFKDQLQRVHPVPGTSTDLTAPIGFEDCSFLPYYGVKAFPYESWHYHEVCAFYDPNHELSAKWAYEAESKCPEYWDEESLRYLLKYNYIDYLKPSNPSQIYIYERLTELKKQEALKEIFSARQLIKHLLSIQDLDEPVYVKISEKDEENCTISYKLVPIKNVLVMVDKAICINKLDIEKAEVMK